MSKQDVNAVRTAQDLEIKYDLSSLAGLKKNYEIQKQGLTKVENELNDFVKVTTKDIEEIKNQVDGNITTWFSSGIPTLDNYPTNEWITENEKINHLGDLYYDNDTGKGYRFTKQDDDYLWYEITDTDTTEALALASKAQDTADSKRRVFLITPYVPYDEGDLWLNNEELYVCNKSKTIDEEYDSNDFEKATKYTDDSALKNFISGEYADDIELINTQIDKKAETWYQSSDPSIVWTTDILKKNHVGDLWYNIVQNKNYIYNSNYNWQEVDGVPDSVYDEIDGKAQIFTSQPTPPYYKGDLFTQGNAGDILVCITERLTGSYNASDWEKAGKYTDDTNLNNFVNVTYAEAMKNLTNQIDSKITTWYYSGQPTLDNEPANSWADEDKLKHTGDLYYDQDTGYVYRFSLEDDIYSWEKITDKDVVESLALANSAKDTADRKRQVFVAEPMPPYDVGDLWIRDEEIYRCQTSRPDGETFEDNDWIKATKYTDDTVANQVDGKLTILSGTVTEIREDVDELTTTMTNTTKVVDEQGNTIGILQEKQSETTQTVNGITTRVSTVENSLASANSNINSLQTQVNGVSADFEEFKDNEYIQSIDNLQKQIDGAIQFWNGAEIPTLNNYPANQWTTENDRINHQADIYTVVQDVQGEMKQGKSYRFDKVNGVWQWIELTDNELSAVQAIAQEALDKAKANATEIGTIKTRVSSLEQTDEQIKASVESIDKQIIPTASISGSNIYVEDASDNPLIKLEIEGKSEQETRSGKNLFNRDKATLNSGVNTSDGNLFYDTTTQFSTDYIDISKYSSISTNGKSNNSGGLYGALYDENKTYLESITSSSEVLTIKNSNAKYIRLTFLNTYLDNLIINEGSTLLEYEQYGASPSPDYPSEIESVGYENLFDINSITEGYVIASNGAINQATLFCYSDYIKVNLNEIYTISRTYDSSPSGAEDLMRVAYYDENYNFIERTHSANNPYVITIPANAHYLRLSYHFNSNLDVMVTRGSIAHPYISYGKYGIEIETVGKNLIDISKYIGVSTANATVNISNNKIEWTNLTTDSYFPSIYNQSMMNDSRFIEQLIGVKSGSKYTLSFNTTSSGACYIYEADKDKNGIKTSSFNIENTQNYTFTTTESTKYIIIRWAKWTTQETVAISNIQLEENLEATKYEEHKSNITLFILNNPLRSLPNGVKDIAYIKNNKLYVDRKIGSVVFDGSESGWINNSTSDYTRFYINITDGLVETARHNIYSNYFRNYDSNSYHSPGIAFEYNNQIFLYPNTNITTINEFKTWLSTHNTQVDYELAEPYTEEIGEIEMPSTFKSVTNISTTDDLEPTLNIEYVRDTTLSNYVENQINKVMTIEERHYSELVIEDNQIKESVTEINSNLSDMTEDVHTVQETLTSTEKTIEVISTNIDKTTGEIREVTTINGYKFNKDGLNIYTNENSFNTLIDNEGTYYKDGDTIISETTKDGFMATSVKNKGSHEYCYDETNKVYEFVKERIEVDGEYGYATFYNGVN